jgi:two-component system response regulator HydG
VRELENVIERAVVLCDSAKLTAKYLPAGVGAVAKGSVRIPGSTLAEVERHLVLATLEACGGRTSQAAQMLNISVRKIQYKLHEYGLTMQRTASIKPPEPE